MHRDANLRSLAYIGKLFDISKIFDKEFFLLNNNLFNLFTLTKFLKKLKKLFRVTHGVVPKFAFFRLNALPLTKSNRQMSFFDFPADLTPPIPFFSQLDLFFAADFYWENI